MMNKKILITGITGMVGSHLADFILKNKKTGKFMVVVDGEVMFLISIIYFKRIYIIKKYF